MWGLWQTANMAITLCSFSHRAMRSISPFPRPPLNLGWLYALCWPIECGRSDSVWILNHISTGLCGFHSCCSWNLANVWARSGGLHKDKRSGIAETSCSPPPTSPYPYKWVAELPSWAQPKLPIHRIMGFKNAYDFKPLVCYTAKDNWYKPNETRLSWAWSRSPLLAFGSNGVLSFIWHCIYVKESHIIHLPNEYAFRVHWDYPGQTWLHGHLKLTILYWWLSLYAFLNHRISWLPGDLESFHYVLYRGEKMRSRVVTWVSEGCTAHELCVKNHHSQCGRMRILWNQETRVRV